MGDSGANNGLGRGSEQRVDGLPIGFAVTPLQSTHAIKIHFHSGLVARLATETVRWEYEGCRASSRSRADLAGEE